MLDIVHALAAGLASAVAWPTCAFLLLGSVIGAVVGLLPGMGGAAMLALMIPFTVSLEPLSAMALLMGAAAVTATTGDLSSILLGVPGEAVSAAMVVDGHELARRGQAGRALGAALMSSLIGALVGVAAFVAIVPFARSVLTSIGSPELFMLTLAGIAFMAPLAGPAPLKGWLAGALGLLFATVGLDSVDSTPRFTFGSLALWDGLGVMPVVLGLFAIPEALLLASSHLRTSPRPVPERGGVARGIREALRSWPLVARCSAIGTAVGMLPGPGGSVAQWVAYAHAIGGRKGRAGGHEAAIEGVIGPGAANNSSLGGALIPTLVLGIPGSVTTAILLGAMSIKGIVPGEAMLRPASAGGQLDFIMALLVFVVAANVLVVGLLTWLLGPLSRIAEVRGSLLVPAVLFLTLVGAFVERNAAEDLLIVAAAGTLGWIMMTLDWPRTPLLLGLILGALAENRLFLSISVYGGAWWHRPGVLLIGGVAIAAIAAGMWRGRSRRPAVATTTTAAPSRSMGDVAFCVMVLLLSATAFQLAREFGPRAGLFPRVILAGAFVLAGAQLIVSWRGARVRRADATTDPAAPLWVAAFLVAVLSLGFDLGAALLTLLYLRFGARERWTMALLQAVVIALAAGVIVETILAVPLPRGWLFAALDP